MSELEPTGRTPEPVSRSGPSRRSVVRVGAAAVWTIPLVQVATSAPAFAASGPATLSISAFTAIRSGQNVSVTIGLQNSGGVPTSSSLVLDFSVPDIGGGYDKKPGSASSLSSGWTPRGGDPLPNGNTGPWTYRFTSTSTLAPGTQNVTFTIALDGPAAPTSSGNFNTSVVSGSLTDTEIYPAS